DPRYLVTLAQAVLGSTKSLQVVFWNVRTAWNQIQQLAGSLVRRDIGPEVIFVRNLNDAYRFPLYTSEERSPEDSMRAIFDDSRRARMELTEFNSINRWVNSNYLRHGFEMEGHELGFYSGRVHLLSLQEVSRFFAIGRNSTDDANRRRWS